MTPENLAYLLKGRFMSDTPLTPNEEYELRAAVRAAFPEETYVEMRPEDLGLDPDDDLFIDSPVSRVDALAAVRSQR